MIKLTELHQGPAAYSEKTKKNISTYELREVYVNPEYVVCVKENKALQNKAKAGALIEGLHAGVSYTQVVMHCPDHSTTNITVLGPPNQIVEDIMAT